VTLLKVIDMSAVPVCRELIILTDAEIAHLVALPDAAHMVEEDLQCELQAGHAGPHLALGQAYGHNELWLRWLPPNQRDLVPLQEEGSCPEEDDQLCELPAGHVGAHSFEMGEGGGRTPTPEMERRMDEVLEQLGD
jgi:hypothetical protein